MPNLQVTLKPSAEQDVVPGDFTVEATFINADDQNAVLNLSQASHPSLVLEVSNGEGKRVLLAPPGAPDERDMAPAEPLPPGESATVVYAGFLDRSLAAGHYRLRYFSPYAALGGSQEDPLASDWIEFTVREMREFHSVEPLERFPRGPEPRPALFLVPWLWWWRWWHWLWCRIFRPFLGRRCDRVLSRDIDEARTETISNAPPGSEAWNGTYGWQARALVTVDESRCLVTATVRVRLTGTVTADQQTAWETAIEAAWSNIFKLCCPCCCCGGGYTIFSDIQFVTSGEHQVVNVGTSTSNMGNWGASDTVDVRHEFGHMLGALDEYFTVDGVNWGAGRQATGSIMNNPANPPEARHYDLIRAA